MGLVRLLCVRGGYGVQRGDGRDRQHQAERPVEALCDALLEALDLLAQRAASPKRRNILVEQIEMVAELAHRTVDTAPDRLRLDGRSAGILESLRRKPAGSGR